MNITNDDFHKELEELAIPLTRLLKESHPDTEIAITSERVTIKNPLLSIPFNRD